LTNYKVILHERLDKQFAEFRKENTQHSNALDKALEKLGADPRGAGGLLQGISQPELQGRVYKLYVGGPRRYRLIYFIPPPSERVPFCPVIPLYFSQVLRGRLDYSKLDLDRVGEDIVADFKANNYSKFRVLG